MPNAQATFKGVAWNHAGKIVEYVLMYVTSVLIARGLGVQDNGTFVGLFSISQLFLVLTSFGLEVSLNKHIPQLTGHARSEQVRYIFRHLLGVRVAGLLVFAVLLYLSLGHLVVFFPPVFEEYIWLVLGYAGVRSLVSLCAIVLTAELQTKATSVINVSTRILEAALIGFMLASRSMTTAAVFTLLMFFGIAQVVAYLVAVRSRLFGRAVRFAVVPLVTFGGVYWTNTIVEYFLGRQGDVLFLSILLPDSTQASLYDVAFSVCQLASLSMTIGLGGITLATSAKLAMRGSEPLERFYGFMIRLTSLLSIPLYAFIFFNADSVLFVLYSSRYVAALAIIQGIAAFRLVGRLFGGPENADFLLSQSRVSTLVVIGVAGAILNVGLNVLLIPRFGAMGAAVASGCGNLGVNMLGALVVQRHSAVRLQWTFWLKVTGSTCGASALCSLVFTPTSTPLIIAQALTYIILIFGIFLFLKPLTMRDGEWLSKVDGRFVGALRLFTRTSAPIIEIKTP